MPTKANKKMMYYLGDTGCEDWNQALDDYLTCKRQNPQITWHNFYIARKRSCRFARCNKRNSEERG